MIYAQIDAQQKAQLDTAMNSSTDAKWYRRLKVIDLSGQGYSVPELSRMFDLGAGAIRRYIHVYNEAGLSGLRPGYGQGRPTTLAWTFCRNPQPSWPYWKPVLRIGHRPCWANIWCSTIRFM